jgi:photosystem II stability/assembly factor-like uncharacterized protein
MKKIIVLISLATSLIQAKAQWQWSNPQPSGYINTKVLFADSVSGYIINDNGDFIKTTDGGNSWKIQQNFPNCSVMDIRDSTFVIAGADTTIYISSDQGQTWQRSFFQINSVIKINIVNKDTIFIVSGNTGSTKLFQSVNGGINWNIVNNDFVIKSIDFISSKIAFATSYGGVYKTKDGGKNWQNVYTPSGGYSFIQVKFWNDSIGYAYQDLGDLIKTTNGGVTWSVSLHHPSGNLESIFFINSQTAFAGGEDGSMYRTDDGGNSWQYSNTNQTGYGQTIYSIYFINQNNGFIVGHRGKILKTTNGGTSWQAYAPSYIEMRGLSFPTPSIGYAASWYNLYKTTNSGQTWVSLPFSLSDHNDRFQYLRFFNKDTGIALADDPVQLYKTYNGGQSWQSISLPILYKDYVTGVFFINNTGYLNINGAYGYTMLQTKDAGETWQVQYDFGQSAGYHNLFFTDEKTGYGIKGPYLYKTSDSAKTWNLCAQEKNAFALNTVWFTNPATGFVMGDDGGNLKTIDSGKTWTHFNIIPDNPNFYDIYTLRFFNKKVGYFLTRLNGSVQDGIYKTINGGVTWKFDNSIPWECKTIEMTNDTAINIAGEYGTILKKDMREYDLDSLIAFNDSACISHFSAQVSAVFSTVDSVWFQFGAISFTKEVLATPSAVTDSSIKAEIAIQGLSPDSAYTVRVKILYKGSYYYSNHLRFRPDGLQQPIIVSNGLLLASNASTGNQWFLNNTAISGATDVIYEPKTSGLYTVQQKLNGCTSPMSAAFNFVATAVNDPVLTKGIVIFPNPVKSLLFIRNKDAQKIRLTLCDVSGRKIQQWQTQKIENSFNMQKLATSIYILTIEEITSHKKIQTKVFKW